MIIIFLLFFMPVFASHEAVPRPSTPALIRIASAHARYSSQTTNGVVDLVRQLDQQATEADAIVSNSNANMRCVKLCVGVCVIVAVLGGVVTGIILYCKSKGC